MPLPNSLMLMLIPLITNLPLLLTQNSLKKLSHESLSTLFEGVRAMAKRMLVWKRYLRIKVSLEMERLDACLLEGQKIKLLRAFFHKALAKKFTHQNRNYLLGSTGVFLAFDAKFSLDASSREVMEKLIMMENQLSICTLQWYMGRWTTLFQCGIIILDYHILLDRGHLPPYFRMRVLFFFSFLFFFFLFFFFFWCVFLRTPWFVLY